MKTMRYALGLALVALATMAPGWAHHVIYLDFDDFDLNAFTSVNGNNPPTANDVAAVEDEILTIMARDFAAYDVYFTTHEPQNGNFTRVKIDGSDQGGLYGCAGPSCCVGGNCSGIDTWDTMTESSCEIYAGSFSNLTAFSGSNDTTARIANGIGGTASHELGHVLDLSHCNAADDSITIGCSDSFSDTDDLNVLWHVMASGSSWGLTSEQRASRDRFFSIHASRRTLMGNVQVRNHWDTLPNINGGAGWADLLYGRYNSPSVTEWLGRLSSGSDFGTHTVWEDDAGKPGRLYMAGDVDGDNREDLVIGHILSSTQVKWYVRLSSGSDFGSGVVWRTDGGDVGDIFRLADVDADGMDDLVYGRPLNDTTVKWFVRLSDGTEFGTYSVWVDDAGSIGDIFMLGDLGGDGDADLLYGRTLSPTEVKWYGRFSQGSSFGSYSVWHDNAGNEGDLFYLGRLGADSDFDLLYGRTNSDTQVKWFGRFSNGSEFGTYSVWKEDAGSAGDLHRIGDGNGDGMVDLYYARNIDQDSLTLTPTPQAMRWYGRLSTGSDFDAWTTWKSDAGDDGNIFP